MDDKEVALAAVAQNGLALRYASVELKYDKEVVLAAVAQEGHALQYASAELKYDKEVVLAAVMQHGLSLRNASAELKADKDVVIAAVVHSGGALKYASVELKSDTEVVLAAVVQDTGALAFSPLKRTEVEIFVWGRQNAHRSFVAFLHAAHPPSSSLRTAPTSRPAAWDLDGVGEDAGCHVRQLIAAFSGAPCGNAWTVTHAASLALKLKRA
jgi:hypothetical protein